MAARRGGAGMTEFILVVVAYAVISLTTYRIINTLGMSLQSAVRCTFGIGVMFGALIVYALG